MKLIKGKAKIFIVALLAIGMIFTVGCTNKDASINEKDAVAKIGDKVIGLDSYNKKLNLFKKGVESKYGDKIWSMDMNGKTYLQVAKESVLEQIVDEEVIIQYMKKQKVEIDDKEVQKQYTAYMDEIKAQKESEKILKDLEENGMDEAFVKNQITTEMYINKFQEKIVKDLGLTDETLKQYYEKNIDTYNNEEVQASHILVNEEEKAKEILGKIKAGEDFAKLAKEFSKDPGSAANGGDLGTFGRGMMVPEFEEVAFSLKAGEVSDVVKTQFGYHIIKVMDKKEKLSTFEEVKENIRANMIQKGIVDQLNKIKKEFKIEKFPEKIK